MSNPYSQQPNLRSLEMPDGQVPEMRLANASEAQALVQQLIMSDNGIRNRKRALCQGLVDGNPPYRASQLKANGRGDACNVNWRIAESYLNQALGAFYDIFNEAPSYATVQTGFGNPQQRQEWSDIITEEFERLQRRDTSFDYNMQLSQKQMVLFGVGPLMFPDKFDWRPMALECKNVLVMEGEKSDVNLWEMCAVRRQYRVHELYDYIRNPEAAKSLGWNIDYTRQAIMMAVPENQQDQTNLSWEWWQKNLKDGVYYTSLRSNTVGVAHVFYREFPTKEDPKGRISHVMVLESLGEGGGKVEYLFQHPRRFANWQEVMHAMYYDCGNGEHHSITGMGIKMYGAMEFQNRLLCNLADKSFAPNILIKPTTADAQTKLSMTAFGQFGLLPKGSEAQQIGLNGMLNDGMAFNQEISGIVASNLSAYRQELEGNSGNPRTATEVSLDASNQAKLGKTQLNRYYVQLDWMYAEKYRRASNPNLVKENPGGDVALEFQERCINRGVPKEALAKVDTVSATRVVGQGSLFMRQQALQNILQFVAMLPEQGRENLVSDMIAAQVGQSKVKRYFDTSIQAKRPTIQHQLAMNQVADMKVGVPAVVTSEQNAVIYAQTFLQAGAQALASLPQGGNPMEVLQFLEILGPAIHAHLQRLQQDQTRAQVFELLNQQFNQLAQTTDKLKAMVQQQAEKQKGQQQQTHQAMSEEQLAMLETTQDIKRRDMKNNASIRHSDEKHRMKMAQDLQQLHINDAKASNQITIDRAKAAASAKEPAQTS